MIVVALHAGAGYFAQPAECICADALRKHCKRRKEADAAENGSESHLVNAVMELERSGSLNCGSGSNLTVAGSVECEAAFMCSNYLSYGAVAVVTNCMHPIYAAKALCDSSKNGFFTTADNGLLKPMILAGKGAETLCASLSEQKGIDGKIIAAHSMNIGIVPKNNVLRAKDAIKEWKIAKKFVGAEKEATNEAKRTRLDEQTTHHFGGRLDTVGGIAINTNGDCEAGVSSGGILLKMEGRLGHSAQFGAAIWAEKCSRNGLSIAVSISGCGEALTRTHLAESLAQQLLSMNLDLDNLSLVEHVKQHLDVRFLNSARLSSFPRDRLLAGGLIAIHRRRHSSSAADEDNKEDSDQTLLIAFHNSEHFPFAFISQRSSQKVQRFKSKNTKIGEFVCSMFPV